MLNKLKTNQKIFAFSLLIAGLVIPLLDIVSMNSGLFGSQIAYQNGNFGFNWWHLFFTFNLITICLVAFSYYFFYRKDLSESLSLILGTGIMWFFGISDLAFFVLQGSIIPPATLPWLNNSLIGWVSHLLGFSQVTSASLLISTALSLVLAWYVIKFMDKKL